MFIPSFQFPLGLGKAVIGAFEAATAASFPTEDRYSQSKGAQWEVNVPLHHFCPGNGLLGLLSQLEMLVASFPSKHSRTVGPSHQQGKGPQGPWLSHCIFHLNDQHFALGEWERNGAAETICHPCNLPLMLPLLLAARISRSCK